MMELPPPEGLKLAIEVHAGLIPGHRLPEFTRLWYWTSDQQAALEAGDPGARQDWIDMAGASREYAATLEDPTKVNWVRRDWIWM